MDTWAPGRADSITRSPGVEDGPRGAGGDGAEVKGQHRPLSDPGPWPPPAASERPWHGSDLHASPSSTPTLLELQQAAVKAPREARSSKINRTLLRKGERLTRKQSCQDEDAFMGTRLRRSRSRPRIWRLVYPRGWAQQARGRPAGHARPLQSPAVPLFH